MLIDIAGCIFAYIKQQIKITIMKAKVSGYMKTKINDFDFKKAGFKTLEIDIDKEILDDEDVEWIQDKISDIVSPILGCDSFDTTVINPL